jgi:hypothetical protein
MKKKIKFNLGRYQQGGCEVVVENGNPVRIFCTDFKGEDKFFIIGAVKHDIAKDNENLDYWDENGNSYFGNFGEFNLCLLVDVPCELKPFDKVLVRDGDEEKWKRQFFDNYNDAFSYPYQCIGGNAYNQCIPYEGNEELVDTTDAPKGGEK